MNVAGRRVLLTGATGGLGRAIANRLARAGAQLCLSGRSEEALAGLAAELEGDAHEVLPADLAEPGAAAALAGAAGAVDVLVANAGVPATGRLGDLTPEQIERMLRINVEAPVILARTLLPGMIERDLGKIVLMGSLAGKAASPRSSIYNATKFSLRGFAFGLNGDLAGSPVSATVVAPGFVRDAGMFADSGAKAPMVLGTTSPERVADAVLRAIMTRRLEITVAPWRSRVMSYFGLVSPRLSNLVQSGPAGQNATAALTAGQVEKR